MNKTNSEPDISNAWSCNVERVCKTGGYIFDEEKITYIN